MIPPYSWRRSSASATLAAAAAFALLAAAPVGQALSLPSVPTITTTDNMRKLVDHSRMIEVTNGNHASQRACEREMKPSHEQKAVSSALSFSDYNNSQERAVSMLKNKKTKGAENETMKGLAEEFDRFMAEDAMVASIVKENISPGSLVDEVQHSKGADILDREVLLKREAIDRRRSTESAEPMTSSAIENASAEPPALSITVPHEKKASSEVRMLTYESPSRRAASKIFNKRSLLTREEEYALAYTIQAGSRVHKLKAEYESTHLQPLSKREWAQLANVTVNDLRKLISDYRLAKHEIVSSNLGLVHAVVKSYARKAKHRGLPLEELTQEGSLGLIRAAELFDPSKGLRFSTYATIWIKGVLSNADPLGEVISVPLRERALWNKVRAVREEMAFEHSVCDWIGEGDWRSMNSVEELARRLGMKTPVIEKHLRRMSQATSVLSLDYQYERKSSSGHAGHNDRWEGLKSSVRFGTDADLAECAQLRADVVAGLVCNLSDREASLMRLRYGLEDGAERTIKECASIMGINRETARLLQHACLEKLREASNMESLQEYLLTVA